MTEYFTTNHFYWRFNQLDCFNTHWLQKCTSLQNTSVCRPEIVPKHFDKLKPKADSTRQARPDFQLWQILLIPKLMRNRINCWYSIPTVPEAKQFELFIIWPEVKGKKIKISESRIYYLPKSDPWKISNLEFCKLLSWLYRKYDSWSKDLSYRSQRFSQIVSMNPVLGRCPSWLMFFHSHQKRLRVKCCFCVYTICVNVRLFRRVVQYTEGVTFCKRKTCHSSQESC